MYQYELEPLTFDSRGLLPAGDYPMTIEQLRESVLVIGQPDLEPWDAAWRRELVDNLAIVVNQLWQVGITEIFIDGSFVEDKAHPNDIDGYFVCDVRQFVSGQLAARLNAVDPFRMWTWDPGMRALSAHTTTPKLPMWHTYRVELFPHYNQGTGIRDELGNNQTFPAAFRKTRSFQPKGIVKIIR